MRDSGTILRHSRMRFRAGKLSRADKTSVK